MSPTTPAVDPRERDAHPDTKPGLDSRVIRARIVRALDHEDRLLLLLWHAEGLTPAEIGSLLHLSPQGVQRRHSRILARLRVNHDTAVARIA